MKFVGWLGRFSFVIGRTVDRRSKNYPISKPVVSLGLQSGIGFFILKGGNFVSLIQMKEV